MAPRLASLTVLLLATGCSGRYHTRVDAPTAVPVGAAAEAVAHAGCTPGPAGCPSVDFVIDDLTVTPADAVSDVARDDRTLRFTAKRAGPLRVALSGRLDGEAAPAVVVVEARVPDGAVIDGCGERAAFVAGFDGTTAMHLTAGGQPLSTKAAVFVADAVSVRHRLGETYVLAGTRAKVGDVVRVTSPLVPGWGASLTVVARGSIDGVRLEPDTVGVGESRDLAIRLSAGPYAVCPSLGLPSEVLSLTPETCRVLWPEHQGRVDVRVRGVAAGECRLQLGLEQRPVATVRVR